jgi:hypothetical protein
MDEKLKCRIQDRWAKLENRLYQLTAILDDLEEIEEQYPDTIDVKSKTAYILLEQEMQLLMDQQKFIESLLK